MIFFFNETATTEIYTYLHTLSLPDALPISPVRLALSEPPPPPPLPTPSTSAARQPAGLVHVPDEVNVCTVGAEGIVSTCGAANARQRLDVEIGRAHV